jgi:hypothetical protein
MKGFFLFSSIALRFEITTSYAGTTGTSIHALDPGLVQTQDAFDAVNRRTVRAFLAYLYRVPSVQVLGICGSSPVALEQFAISAGACFQTDLANTFAIFVFLQ